MSIIGTIFRILEVCSYIILYYHVWKHDNDVAAKILNQQVIRNRNRRNAITISGLFATWILEVSYLIFTGFLSFLTNRHDLVRELVWSVKAYEYFCIPCIQIYTSPQMKLFKSKHN